MLLGEDRLLTSLSSKSVLVLLCFDLKHRTMKRKRKGGLQKGEDAFRSLGDLTCKGTTLSSGLNSSKKQVKGKNKENKCEHCNVDQGHSMLSVAFWCLLYISHAKHYM